MNYIVTFRSRTNAVKFHESLKMSDVPSMLINTPKTAGIGCGLSVKTADLAAVRKILFAGEYYHFHAIFKSENNYLTRID